MGRRKIEVVIVGDAKSYQRATSKAGLATRTLGSAMARVFGPAAVVAGVGLGLKKAITAAGDFQQTLDVLQVTAKASDDQMQRMRDTAMKLGADVTLPGTSAADAAQAMNELAKGGLNVRDAMDAAKGTLQLAAAAQMGNAEAATILADSLNSFELKGRDAARVSDLLAASATATSGTMEDVSEALKNTGSVAHTLKVPIEDTVTGLALLAKAGIKGADAGTSLKMMLLRMGAPTAAAKRAMDKLGVSTFDQSGKMRSLADIAGQYRTKLAGLNDAEKIHVLNTIFGARAVRAASIVLDGGSKKFTEMKQRVTEQGRAAKMAAAQNKGFKGALDGLNSVVDTLAIEMGESMLPALTTAATWLASELPGAAHATMSAFGSVKDAFVDTWSSMATVGAPVISMVGGVAKVMLTLTGAVLDNRVAMVSIMSVLAGVAAGMVAYKVAVIATAAAQKAMAVATFAAQFTQVAARFGLATASALAFNTTLRATRIAMLGTGIGILIGGATLLASVFNRGPSAAEQQAKGLERVRDTAREAADALDDARAAADKITRAKLRATSAALAVAQAQRNYNQAVQQYGPNSLEAAQALNQFQQSQLDAREATRDNNKAVRDSSTSLAANIAKQIAAKQAADDQVQTLRRNVTGLMAVGASSAEGRRKLAELNVEIASMDSTSAGATKKLAAMQASARKAANTLKGSTAPGAAAARKELLAIADANPNDLPKVIKSIQDGVAKSKSAAKRGTDEVKRVLDDVDTTVSLSSWVQSIRNAGGQAFAAADNAARMVRQALMRANADERNSPSANDLMRTSLATMNTEVASGMRRVNATAAAGAAKVRTKLAKAVYTPSVKVALAGLTADPRDDLAANRALEKQREHGLARALKLYRGIPGLTNRLKAGETTLARLRKAASAKGLSADERERRRQAVEAQQRKLTTIRETITKRQQGAITAANELRDVRDVIASLVEAINGGGLGGDVNVNQTFENAGEFDEASLMRQAAWQFGRLY